MLFDTINEIRGVITREVCMLEGTLYVFKLGLSVLMCGLLLLLLMMALKYATGC
jgi:hypothetical protein